MGPHFKKKAKAEGAGREEGRGETWCWVSQPDSSHLVDIFMVWAGNGLSRLLRADLPEAVSPWSCEDAHRGVAIRYWPLGRRE